MTDADIPPEVTMEHAPCPLGCADESDLVLAAKDHITKRAGTYQVVRCRTCGLVRTDPRPTPQTIGHFYPDEYPPYAAPAASPAPPGLIRRLVRRATAPLANRSRRLPPGAPGRLLEIGCASGDFLAEVRALGWQAEGLEYSKFAAASARERGFTVFEGSLEAFERPDRSYDMVVGWMVVEHLHEPVESLKKLRRMVRPDGWLAISVPDFSCLGQKLLGEAWYNLQVPAHLYHFTPSTVTRVLEVAGWQVDRITHQSNVSSWMVSGAWWLERRGVAHAVSQRLEHYPDWGVASRMPFFPLGAVAGLARQSGRMNVWARAAETPQP